MNFNKLISTSGIINIKYSKRNKKQLEKFINILIGENLNDYLV